MANTTYFCTLPSYHYISVSFRLTTQGSLKSLTGSEYKSVAEWTKHEFLKHLPDYSKNSMSL